MSTKKIVSIIFIIVLFVGILIAGAYFISQQSSQLLAKKALEKLSTSELLAKDIEYTINSGQETKTYQIDFSASSTVFSILQGLSQKENIAITQKDYPSMGVLVQSIGGVENGQDNKYWQYWVNGVLGEVASDKKFLKPGDRVEWKFDIAPSF